MEAMLAEASAAAAEADAFASSAAMKAAPAASLSSAAANDAGPRTPTSARRLSRRRKSSVLPSASKLDRWDTKLGQYPLLGWLEERTGIRKLYLASALLLLCSLLVFRGTGMGVISVCVGFLYPLHMSLKTIENCASLFEQISGANRARHTEQEIADKREEIISALRQWLIYWLVYGLFNTLESLSDSALSWLPVYHPVKLAFLLWCFLPRYQGSQLVFDILVRPVLIRHESAIEESVETAHQAAIASVGRVARTVRAKSIQLSQAIQVAGVAMLGSGSSGASSGPASSPLNLDRLKGEQVRKQVEQIEARTRGLSGISEVGEGEPGAGRSRQTSRTGSATTSPAKQWPPAANAQGQQREEGEQQQQDGVSAAFRAASRLAEQQQRR